MQNLDNETLVEAFGYFVATRKKGNTILPDCLKWVLASHSGEWVCYDPIATDEDDWAVVGTRVFVIARTAREIIRHYDANEICATLRAYKNRRKSA